MCENSAGNRNGGEIAVLRGNTLACSSCLLDFVLSILSPSTCTRVYPAQQPPSHRVSSSDCADVATGRPSSARRYLACSEVASDFFKPRPPVSTVIHEEHVRRRRRRRRLKNARGLRPLCLQCNHNRSFASTSCAYPFSLKKPLNRLLLLYSDAEADQTGVRRPPSAWRIWNTFNPTIYLLLSVFLFLSTFVLPICNADSQSPLLRRMSRREIPIQSLPQPIFRSPDYDGGAGPVSYNVGYSPGDSSRESTATVFASVSKQNANTNADALTLLNLNSSTTANVKEPPVVWVPYLGVVVIFAVFMVLIVTFWLHIRRSRYRAIQLVKSSPNSEWNEIQPGRWEASYGGHVYTVNQITQTRVLGAIAAAAVTAMGQGVRRAISGNQLSPPAGDSPSKTKGSSMVSSPVGEVDRGDNERTGLLISSADESSSKVKSSASSRASVAIATHASAASKPPHGHQRSGPSASGQFVPISDSIWLLTEDQLMESIKSSNGSQRSTPTPTPTSPPIAVTASTPTPCAVFPIGRGRPPPVPPRGYGTFAQPGQSAMEAAAKLAMVDNRAGHSRVSSQRSLPANPAGEIALSTMSPLSPSRHAAELVSIVDSESAFESDDVCAELQPAGSPSIVEGSTWINESFDVGDDYPMLSPTIGQLSIDEMTLPEPEPWVPNANTSYAPVPRAVQGMGRATVQRSNTGSASSYAGGQQGSSGQGTPSMGGINMIQGRRLNAVRGSVRGRGRGAAGRGQLSSLMTYSNIGKKKGGFIIPRG